MFGTALNEMNVDGNKLLVRFYKDKDGTRGINICTTVNLKVAGVRFFLIESSFDSFIVSPGLIGHSITVSCKEFCAAFKGAARAKCTISYSKDKLGLQVTTEWKGFKSVQQVHEMNALEDVCVLYNTDLVNVAQVVVDSGALSVGLQKLKESDQEVVTLQVGQQQIFLKSQDIQCSISRLDKRQPDDDDEEEDGAEEADDEGEAETNDNADQQKTVAVKKVSHSVSTYLNVITDDEVTYSLSLMAMAFNLIKRSNAVNPSVVLMRFFDRKDTRADAYRMNLCELVGVLDNSHKWSYSSLVFGPKLPNGCI